MDNEAFHKAEKSEEWKTLTALLTAASVLCALLFALYVAFEPARWRAPEIKLTIPPETTPDGRLMIKLSVACNHANVGIHSVRLHTDGPYEYALNPALADVFTPFFGKTLPGIPVRVRRFTKPITFEQTVMVPLGKLSAAGQTTETATVYVNVNAQYASPTVYWLWCLREWASLFGVGKRGRPYHAVEEMSAGSSQLVRIHTTVPLERMPLLPPTFKVAPNGHRWVLPNRAYPADPRWGHQNGIQVGLPHREQPRGILRVFYPRLTASPDSPINYLAVEPVTSGTRFYSELEPSLLDGTAGKRMWFEPIYYRGRHKPTLQPYEPVVQYYEDPDGESMLVSDVCVEPFKTGERVQLRIIMTSDRPEEVGIETSTWQPNDRAMDSCIITATMGNYTRLRHLHQTSNVSDSLQLWPGFAGSGFTRGRTFPGDSFPRTKDGDLIVCATSNESDLSAGYAPGGWGYTGPPVTHYWRVPAHERTEDLVVRVNGRATYYGTKFPIPGGVAFENFETERRFQPGQSLWFGVTTQTAEMVLKTR